MDSLCLRTGLSVIAAEKTTPFRSLFSRNKNNSSSSSSSNVQVMVAVKAKLKEINPDNAVSVGRGKLEQSEGRIGRWVKKVPYVNSLWAEKREIDDEDENCVCDCKYGDDDDERDDELVYNRSSFSKLLKRVSLGDARMYGKMSYLGELAYSIPTIKTGNRLKRYGLQYVTSSVEKRQLLASEENKEHDAYPQQPSNESRQKENSSLGAMKLEDDKKEWPRIGPSAAFHIAASAASFFNTRTHHIFRWPKFGIDEEIIDDGKGDEDHIGEMASFIARTDSVTAVVAAKEEVKQAVADDLNSVSSAPCEWYICDDVKSATRFFVIQGSETLASWKANLLFEPTQFEEFDTYVHRGIYEAAKGIYQQMLPEIHAYVKAHGRHAKLRFTGHSLGGSLSLLINLMLLIRGEVPLSSLLPVITFGSPTIMCGGDELLRKLGLPRSHIQAVTMHRDIVPRAFSCNYPNHVAKLLKAINRNFRNHPCLNNQSILYAPMGELLILQPDTSYSPQHDLLPSGSGLFHLNSDSDAAIEDQKLRAAKLAFLNSPHPLDILRDRSAYGAGGSIQRDHDMSSYLKCVRSVIRHELTRVRKAEKERRQQLLWRLIFSPVIRQTRIIVRLPRRFDVSGILRSGSESVIRLRRIVASTNLHLIILWLFPARWLFASAVSAIGGFRLR